ncbi:MAG: hypothetical protein AAF624_00935 [Bacteroidota bacterium]
MQITLRRGQPPVFALLGALLFLGCASTGNRSQLLIDSPPEIARIAVMADLPDSDMRSGFVTQLRESLSLSDIEVIAIRPSRDPRQERIAQHGAEVDADVVLVAELAAMETQSTVARQQVASQRFELAYTLYGVSEERRIWTSSAISGRSFSRSGGRESIGKSAALKVLELMREDRLVPNRSNR